ncbi:acetoacetate-CoA ligase [Exophiala mesophila]|uniref:Acetoacetate-CoA ligase n=1 Tax=Exophiala mesophila TaxID=212818 RepID=A0A0D1WMH0_EXOME|nr:acetoacetate-CoA ligase [Exophiala mesophila]KIV90220.1 acetoacetate-CoA ligase [Exophiala mesophila]
MALKPVYNPPIGLRTSLDTFREKLNFKYNLNLKNFTDVHDFSVQRLNDFWLSVWEFTNVKASIQPTKAVHEDESIDCFPLFFEETRLNFAENMIFRQIEGIATIDLNEGNLGSPEEYTWRDLRELVRKYSNALRSSGLQRGGVVALIGSNCTRSLALLLATASVGAVFASFATDMGDKALDDRLGVLKPQFLFAESSYVYNGKRHNIVNKIDVSISKLQRDVPCEAIIIGPSDGMTSQRTSFNQFLKRATDIELVFEQVPFNTPLVVMFSSGTTGSPKGIVHSHGGLVLNGLKEFILHNCLGSGDVHYHYTNIGWTLWNISIGALFAGSSLVLYDGSPFYPTPEKFLEFLFKINITSFGAGPRYFSELQKLNVSPKKYTKHLHSLLSTGAVLTPPLATWLAAAFGPVCQLSMSGGTELCGAFLHGSRSVPSYAGELAVKALGMDVVVFSPEGRPVADGESGELVCRKPFPNMPVKFWDDPGRSRYYNSYFANFPNVWTHGDFIQVNPVTKGVYVLGRSDGVLNPSGVRFGTSEIYNIISTPMFEQFISDAVVVGQQRLVSGYSDPAERVVLFIKCTPEATSGTINPNPKIISMINQAIERNLSRRHVPSFIFETGTVPYNVNGKKLEIQVKAILNGGKEAMAKLKVTKQELKQLEWYEKFFAIEDFVNNGPLRTSKL